MAKLSLNEPNSSSNNETIRLLFLWGSHTGYLFKTHLGNFILDHSTERSQNGISRTDGPYPINQKQLKQMRLASKADFDDFELATEAKDPD